VHHPGLHRRARRVQHQDHRILGRPGGPAAVRLRLRALLVHLTGERTERTLLWNPLCLPPASASRTARRGWATGGSCSATAPPASCWRTPTAACLPTPASAAGRGAPCSARTAPST